MLPAYVEVLTSQVASQARRVERWKRVGPIVLKRPDRSGPLLAMCQSHKQGRECGRHNEDVARQCELGLSPPHLPNRRCKCQRDSARDQHRRIRGRQRDRRESGEQPKPAGPLWRPAPLDR